MLLSILLLMVGGATTICSFSSVIKAQEFASWKSDGIVIDLNTIERPKITGVAGFSPLFGFEDENHPANPFFRGMAASMGDDLPRVAYADYLEDSGDPESAEFIRLQCAVSHLPRPIDFRTKMIRARELARKNAVRWFGPLVRRLKNLPRQAANHVTKFEIETMLLRVVMRRGTLWGVDFYNDIADSVTSKALTILLKNAFLKLVIKPEGLSVAPLANDFFPLDESLISPFKSLEVWISPGHTGASGLATLQQPRFLSVVQKVEDLTISFGAEGNNRGFLENIGHIMATREEFRRLQRVAIIGIGDRDDPPVGSFFVREFTQGAWPHLKEFAAPGMNINFIGTEALAAAASRLPALQFLDLAQNSLEDDALRDLGRTTFKNLVQLDLSGNPFTAAGLDALTKAEWARKLVYLDVHKTSIRATFEEQCKNPNDGRKCSRRGKACDLLQQWIERFYR